MTLAPGIRLALRQAQGDLEQGRKVGHGEAAPLGACGMHEVCKGRDTRLDRTVAIKILPEGEVADPHEVVPAAGEAR